VGITMNGWFAPSLGSSDTAGWLFLAVGVAAVVALAIPSTSSAAWNARQRGADRLVVITDEQSHDRVPQPEGAPAYMINVASNRNGVGYGRWTHIDGFSENVLRFMREIEAHD
jgi:hypothetical protein